MENSLKKNMDKLSIFMMFFIHFSFLARSLFFFFLKKPFKQAKMTFDIMAVHGANTQKEQY